MRDADVEFRAIPQDWRDENHDRYEAAKARHRSHGKSEMEAQWYARWDMCDLHDKELWEAEQGRMILSTSGESWRSIKECAAYFKAPETTIRFAVKNGHPLRCAGGHQLWRKGKPRPEPHNKGIVREDGQRFLMIKEVAGSVRSEWQRLWNAIQDGTPYLGFVYAYVDSPKGRRFLAPADPPPAEEAKP